MRVQCADSRDESIVVVKLTESFVVEVYITKAVKALHKVHGEEGFTGTPRAKNHFDKIMGRTLKIEIPFDVPLLQALLDLPFLH